MGVYIHGMAMPEDGETATLTICADGIVFEEFKEPGNVFHAVPVPPHGRLGDLDALAQQIEHERFHHTHTDGLASRHHVAEYGHFLKAISDAPTIIPEEEEST